MARSTERKRDRFDELAAVEEELARLRSELLAMPDAIEIEHQLRDLQVRRDALRVAGRTVGRP